MTNDRRGTAASRNKFAFAQWLISLGTLYVAIASISHLVWESTQLPLYTVWRTGTVHENFVAVVHCTGGDVLITISTLLIAVLIARLCGWRPFGSRIIFAAIVLGVGYTIFSEWLNVEVRRSWSYSSAMPVLPWLGTGLAPVLQWIFVPGLGFAMTARFVAASQKERSRRD